MPLGQVAEGRDRHPYWKFDSTALDTEGDHFTMMDDHAPQTAQAVNVWPAGLAAEGRDRR